MRTGTLTLSRRIAHILDALVREVGKSPAKLWVDAQCSGREVLFWNAGEGTFPDDNKQENTLAVQVIRRGLEGVGFLVADPDAQTMQKLADHEDIAYLNSLTYTRNGHSVVLTTSQDLLKEALNELREKNKFFDRCAADGHSL